MAKRLELKKPVDPFSITQKFGEDLSCVDIATRKVCVVRTAGESCPPGFESLYTSSGRKGHDGIDFLAEEGHPIYAALNGRVTEILDEADRGLGVGILSRRRYLFETSPEGKAGAYRAKARYWHLSRLNVAYGDTVRAGDLIGWAESTGLSLGSHLHFEVKPQKRTILGSYVNAFPKNGYLGAVDPLSYFID